MRTTEPPRFDIARLLPTRIGARLYGLVGLALVTVAMLAAAASHFVKLAGESALDIRSLVQIELWQVSELELLLERHRRIIESAPVELDIERLADLQTKSVTIVSKMMESALDTTPFSAQLRFQLPELAEEGAAALRLAQNFAQAAAIEQVQVYADHARKLAAQIAAHKAEQVAAVERDVQKLVASGAVLNRWVFAGTVVALLLIGPFSLLITSQIVRRLKAMTATMLTLAANDTTVHVSGTRFRDELGDMARAMGVFKSNAIDLLRTKREIETLNARFVFALENMSRGLSMFDADRCLIVCNDIYRQLYDLPTALTKPGTPFEAIAAHRIATGTGRVGETPGARLPWPFDSASVSQTERDTLTHQLADGRIVQIAIQLMAGGGWVALHEDVTAERQQEARIDRLAHTDTVTGIANRHSFQETLKAAVQNLQSPNQRSDGGGFAVHWIDLDKFKEVNDTFGHPMGDALLVAVARRLTSAVRGCDVVARLGGDEFAVLQGGVTNDTEAATLATRLVATLRTPYDLSGQRVEIGASVGVVIAPHHGRSAEDLIRNADIALYRAKADGRGRHVAFDDALEQDQNARRGLAVDLVEAIAAESFTLDYQPILDLELGRVAVCEALLRWHHPVRGMISPAVFIPVAEESGAIVTLGAWALRRACQDATTWPEHIKVAVNLSAVQFQRSDLVATVTHALAQTGLAPHRLELEITETVLLTDDTATLDVLHRLRALGVSIALDDFGTGYSSLSYLRRFPFDKIKIDQTFVREQAGGGSRAENVAIVKAVANLAKSLRMATVAEGVETTDHLSRVAAAGVDQVQGYLISRPVPACAILEAIHRASSLASLCRTTPLARASGA